MAKVSERFGSVLRMPPIYRWFYVAEFFAGIAALAHLMQASTYLAASTYLVQATTSQEIPPQIASLDLVATFHHIPLAISVTIGLMVTWKYWGWLITDRKR